MKQEYVFYAKQLDSIGDKYISANTSIKKPEDITGLTFDEAITYKNKLNTAIEGFVEAKEEARGINPPFIVQNPHKKLLERFEQFSNSAIIMRDSLDTENPNGVEINKEAYEQGFLLHDESTKEINRLTQIIGNRLTK